MPRLTPEQFRDEAIYRKTRVLRYINGQVKIVHALVNELNEKIARYCLKKKMIETKGQYADLRTYIRERCMQYREKLRTHLEKELKGFIREQVKWTYDNSPVKLEKADDMVKKVYRNMMFEAFSDTDTVKGFLQRVFNQIFQLWNVQSTIAYRTKLPMEDMVRLVLGKVPK